MQGFRIGVRLHSVPPFNQRFFWWGDHILCEECRWDRLKEAPGSNINPLADCQDGRALDFDYSKPQWGTDSGCVSKRSSPS